MGLRTQWSVHNFFRKLLVTLLKLPQYTLKLSGFQIMVCTDLPSGFHLITYLNSAVIGPWLMDLHQSSVSRDKPIWFWNIYSSNSDFLWYKTLVDIETVVLKIYKCTIKHGAKH